MKPFTVSENRASDIERTADEIRAQYLVTHAGNGASEHWRMLFPVLLNSELSDGAKVQYALLLPERKNFAWSNERIGKLTGKSPRTVERYFEELETEGYLKPTRRSKKPSSRAFLAPKNSILVAAEELLERINAQNGETTDLSFDQVRETTNLSRSNDRNVAQPLRILPLREEEEDKSHRAREGCEGISLHLTTEDKALHFAVMNAFSRDPRDLATAGLPIMPRADADANLASRFSGWTQTAPAEIVLQCLRDVLSDMQLRAHDPNRTKTCKPTLSGFSGYLTACMKEALPKAIEAAGIARTKVAGEQAVQQSRIKTQDAIGGQQLAAHAGAIERNTAKRIEDGNARANGASAPRTSQNDRYIERDGGTFFNPKIKLVTSFGVDLVLGFHTDKLVKEMRAKGATIEDFEEAFGKESGRAGDRTKTREEVLQSVRHTVEKALEKRREDEIKARYGDPESLCGGEPHPDFKSKYACLSREFVE